MPSLVKDMRVSNITRSNFFVTAMVLVVIIALFFIPELVSFQRSFSKKERRVAETSVVDELIESRKVENITIDEPDSPLEKIWKLVRRDSRDSSEEASKIVIGEDGARAALRLDGSSAPRFANGEQISWKTLRSDSSIRAYKAARKEALALAKTISEEAKSAKYALFDFSNGLTKVIDGVEKSMRPEEAAAYLEHLDQAVTEAFLKDRVERESFVRWTKISLGSYFENSRSQKFKMGATPSFNPHLTLTYVAIKQPPDHFGRFSHKQKPTVYAEGYVLGKDVKRLELVRDGGRVKSISLRAKADSRGRRWFKIGRRDARGIYTIRVYDREGNKTTRSYSFYDRASHFRWLKERGGEFAIPFEEMDPRYNTYFRLNTAKSSKSWGNLRTNEGDFPMQAF